MLKMTMHLACLQGEHKAPFLYPHHTHSPYPKINRDQWLRNCKFGDVDWTVLCVEAFKGERGLGAHRGLLTVLLNPTIGADLKRNRKGHSLTQMPFSWAWLTQPETKEAPCWLHLWLLILCLWQYASDHPHYQLSYVGKRVWTLGTQDIWHALVWSNLDLREKCLWYGLVQLSRVLHYNVGPN